MQGIRCTKEGGGGLSKMRKQIEKQPWYAQKQEYMYRKNIYCAIMKNNGNGRRKNEVRRGRGV